MKILNFEPSKIKKQVLSNRACPRDDLKSQVDSGAKPSDCLDCTYLGVLLWEPAGVRCHHPAFRSAS